MQTDMHCFSMFSHCGISEYLTIYISLHTKLDLHMRIVGCSHECNGAHWNCRLFCEGYKTPISQCFKPSFVENTANKGLKSYFQTLYEVKLRKMVSKLTLRGITPTLMLISRMASAQGTVLESLYLSSIIQIPLSFQCVTLGLCIVLYTIQRLYAWEALHFPLTLKSFCTQF